MRIHSVSAYRRPNTKLRGKPKQIVKVDGVPTWKTSVSANGEATLIYELKLEN